MIYKLDKVAPSAKFGNKANSLIEMKRAGFSVPNGFIIDSESFVRFLDTNKISESLDNDLKRKKLSKETLRKFEASKFSEKLNLDPKKTYAIRSSCTKEDLEDASFAGQYQSYLFVKPEDVKGKIIECYKATYNDNIIAYCRKNNIRLSALRMAVVVQEMVDADYSGICFTIDPTIGDDTNMLIEIGEGIGENIVSGHNKPEQYHFDWFKRTVDFKKSNKILSKEQVMELGETLSDIQAHFGYPCDIEFALKDDKLYILQARKITKIAYNFSKDLWTITNFKDSGVSATVCKPFMSSIYLDPWGSAYPKYMNNLKALSKKYLAEHPAGVVCFGRPYWNLGLAKKTLSQIIGFRESEFDKEYGIKPTYTGDGLTTRVTPKNLFQLARIAIAYQTNTRKSKKHLPVSHRALLEVYDEFLEKFETEKQGIVTNWREVVFTFNSWALTDYFEIIFINTVQQPLLKKDLLKHLSEDDYLDVFSGIKNISHMRPYYAMWDASRKFRKDAKLKKYWLETSASQIRKDFENNPKRFPELKKIIQNFGYHSDKELDVSHEFYFENPTSYIVNLKNITALDDSHSPANDRKTARLRYRKALAKLKSKTGKRKYRKLEAKIKAMREMMWWREEFRDITTKIFYLDHIYTKALGEHLEKQNAIKNASDIWMVDYKSINKLVSKGINHKFIPNFEEIAQRNMKYYNAYRNYSSDSELIPGVESGKTSSSGRIRGLGACAGKVTATARVIEDISEIDKLKGGDILVTKFTDTGWTPKFAILAGIVTECGGVLCHASIVSREYGIPTIVSCSNAMKKIKDGQIITIDGSTGEITLEEK